MSDSSDRPFGHDTLKLRAMFVPETARNQATRGDIARSVGHDAAKVSAAFVPEGGKPPGPTFVRIGNAQFRPDGDGAASRAYSSRQASRPAADRADRDQPDTLSPMPPVPALARGAVTPTSAGIAAWRAMAAPGSRTPASLRQSLARRQAVNVTERAPSAAADPPPDAPRSD